MELKKLNMWRVVMCAVLLCALIAGMMYFSPRILDFATEKLENINPKKEEDMKNTVWLIRLLLNALPVCLLCAVMSVVYSFNKRGDYIGYREKFIVFISTALFTFLVLLPAVVCYSVLHKAYTDPETGEEILSLLQRTGEWFMWQFLIFCPFVFYYKVKFSEVTEERMGEQPGDEE